MHVVTHSKDIDLSQIYGDSYVEDRDGSISIEPAAPTTSKRRTTKAISS